MEILQLTDSLPFGKFKGWEIELLLLGKSKKFPPNNIDDEDSINPQISYLDWFDKNVKDYEFSKEIKSILTRKTKEIRENALESERIYKHNQWILSQPPYSTPKKSYNKRYSNMNEDYQEAGMSLGDMGYTGDGW